MLEQEKAPTVTESLEVDAATRLSNLICDIREVRSSTGDFIDLSCESEFLAFIESCINRSDDSPLDFVAFPLADKALRTSMHQIVKAHVTKFVETETKQVEGMSYII